MKSTDTTTPLRPHKRALYVWSLLFVVIGLVGLIGGAVSLAIFLAWTSAKSAVSTTNTPDTSIVAKSEHPITPAKGPAPKGFDANDVDITYKWLRTEYTTVEKTRSNEAAYVTSSRNLRDKFDSLEGQQVTWKFEIQQVRNGEKGKMIVDAFYYYPRLPLAMDIPMLPNVSGGGVALSITNFDTFNGAKQVNSQKGFLSGIAVPAEGAVLEAIQGDHIVLNAKILHVVEYSGVRPLRNYTVCFVVTDPKLTFLKK